MKIIYKEISKIHYTKKSGIITITFDQNDDGTAYKIKMPFIEAVLKNIVKDLYIKTKSKKSCQKTQNAK